MANRTSRDVLLRGLRVLGTAIREEPRLFTLAFLGSALFAVLTVGGAFLVGAVVGEVVLPAINSGEVDEAALALGAGALVALSLLKILSIFGRRLGAGFMQFSLQASYRRRVTRRYLELPMAWHRQHATGTLLSNANSDVEAAWYSIAPMPFAAGTVVMLLGALAALFATDWVFGLIGLVLFTTLLMINTGYSRRMAPRQMRAQQLRAEVSAIAHESFDGALVVKTMGREAEETARFAGRAGELRDTLINVGRLRGVFEPLLDTLPSLGTLAALLIGGWRLRQGAVNVTEVVSVCYLFTVMAMPIRAIGWVLAELPRSVAGWDRLQRVLTATGEMSYGTRELDRRGPAPLCFDHVYFSYGDAKVLHDVSFTVPAGRTVALVGRTGSGKSTIASLAARLVDVDSGTVTLDGVDVRELSAQSLARTVALVPQVPFAFDDTVRANVSLDRTGIGRDAQAGGEAIGRDAQAGGEVIGRDAQAGGEVIGRDAQAGGEVIDDASGKAIDDAAVWAALRLAQADGFVARLPEGLDTELGERGTTLSGGQRQRLTLARALAGQPRLLVLDDATSAVDPRVEAAILSGLRSSYKSASILVVAYRRATIALADEVVYLEHGRVAARGTHAELLATVPAYANLVTAYEQAEAERERERAYEETEVSA